MGKQLIRLTESDLHRIIKESVYRILNEDNEHIRRMMSDPTYALQNSDNDLNSFHKNQELTKPSVDDEDNEQWFNSQDNDLEKDDQRLYKWASENYKNNNIYFKGLKDFNRKHHFNGRKIDGENLHTKNSFNRDLKSM